MNVKIVVDSTADMIPEVEKSVKVVPLTVHFGEEEYIDGVTIDHKTFYEKMINEHAIPKTSLPSVQDYLDVLRPYAETETPMIVICISS